MINKGHAPTPTWPMTCARGKASPDDFTKLRLFAASAGYCQRPSCIRPLFIVTGTRRIHIAEMAHIVAANDGGARANSRLATAARGAFDNLILLCPDCHSEIDKGEADYPSELIQSWKREHAERLLGLFGARTFATRAEARQAIEPLLRENHTIFKEYSPDLSYGENPESEEAVVWQRHMRERIIPNNRRILAILEVNRGQLSDVEAVVLDHFRLHVFDLEARHLTTAINGGQRRFPAALQSILENC